MNKCVYVIPIVCLLLICNVCNGQSHIIQPKMICSADELKQRGLQTNEKYRQATAGFRLTYAKALSGKLTDGALDTTTIYSVPVVIHIIYSGEVLGATENPTNDNVQSVIKSASDLFRYTSKRKYANNPFSGADAKIQLCIARTDPHGNATTGIIRHVDSLQAHQSDYISLEHYLLNISWDTSKYCNLFIISSLRNIHGGVSGTYDPYFDGTIYDSYSWGAILICHEIGHYFNLIHTFTGECVNNNCVEDGDEICDTPPRTSTGLGNGSCANPANTCTSDTNDTSLNNPFRPVSLGSLGDRKDAVENFMDYTFACATTFTKGQVRRMRLYIQEYRKKLVTNSNCNISLPMQLMDFAGVRQKSCIALRWTTVQESEMKKYNVERSVNGVNFSTIGSVSSINSIARFSYYFTDTAISTLSSGKLYYRLQQIEVGGRSTYSKIVTIGIAGSIGDFKVGNTLFRDDIIIFTHATTQQTVQIRIVNLAGKTLYSKKAIFTPGNFAYTIHNLSFLPTGSYIIQITGADLIFSSKVVKL